MTSPLVMRAARRSDLDALMELAEMSGPGFTSLPVDERLMETRLALSEEAFAGRVAQPQTGKFLMMLEDAVTGTVAGCSAVKAGVGIDRPFFNYRIITVSQASESAGRRFDMDALILTNEFVGYTEVGTLFLRPDMRGGGAGRLAAQARYLLMAAAPEAFGDRILSELRGVVDDAGKSAFWDCLGVHFFRMTFPEADFLSAVSGNQFILDLMPKFPIYVDLLPPEGREVIGRVHPQGVGALKLLEWEGFRFNRVVDIFDGGPMVTCERTHIRTIRDSRRVTLEAGDVTDADGTWLVSSDRLVDFRVTLSAGRASGSETLIVAPDTLDRLHLKPGDGARIVERSRS